MSRVQVLTVNPASDNIFRHVDTETAHIAIVGLIYCSMWMGALGWDVVSTISFDIRLLRQTKWKSSFGAIYSIAYLLSRYVALAWLITTITNTVLMTDECDAWTKGSTTLFSIAVSSITLVFCLRTCSLWHNKARVVYTVIACWILVVAFSVLLPIMSYGDQLNTSNFCTLHFGGFYVVGVLSALILFDLFCLILTVCKLNKAGWRGMLRAFAPDDRHNLDSEDVKVMLVQKTTAYFVLQFLFLLAALVVFVVTNTYLYRKLNVVASVAVGSSMAGRIFRRAWRQTRDSHTHKSTRPPSYRPAWNRGSEQQQQHPPPSSGEKEDDSDFDYVEGEFGSKSEPVVVATSTRAATPQLDTLENQSAVIISQPSPRGRSPRRSDVSQPMAITNTGSSIPFANLTGSSSRSSYIHTPDATWTRRSSPSIAPDERRRMYIASPPLSHSVRLSERNTVYDVDVLKAAAKLDTYALGTRPLSGDGRRPKTAPTLTQQTASHDADDENAMSAFLHTVDEDTRHWCAIQDDDRPRTSRGATADEDHDASRSRSRRRSSLRPTTAAGSIQPFGQQQQPPPPPLGSVIQQQYDMLAADLAIE